VNATNVVERVQVMGGDGQVVSQVGLHLLGELADRLGLSSGYSGAVPWSGDRAPAHDRGRLLTQVAVMVAGGGACVADMAALRDQPDLFGDVASAPTIWRALHSIDGGVLDGLRRARGDARAKAWQTTEVDDIVLDVDAALVEVHSANKEQAASSYKGGYGFHPMFCFADATGEALAGILRPGNATANSATDQLAVVDMALAQLPEHYRAGHHPGDDAAAMRHRIVVRADTAGAVASFVHGLAARNVEFSVGGG
jgi:choline dehydrogenase-like flavoprotein